MNDEAVKRQLRAMVDGSVIPVSPSEAMLRTSSPSRKSRQVWHLTSHRLIVVAVAAAIVVVFFVPLPSLSLFNRLTGNPATTSTTGNHSKTLASVDLSATPAGWVPVDYGDVQISVPPTWWVLYDSSWCESGSKIGDVFINPSGGYCGASGKPKTETTIVLKTAARYKNPAKYGQRQLHNGVPVYALYSYAPTPNGGNYLIPSLGVELEAEGPLAQRVLNTLTPSPRFVSLAPGPAPAVPLSWQWVTFAGLSFSAPAGWRTYRTSMWLGLGGFCTTQGVALAGDVVSLTTDTRPGLSGCPAPIRQPPVRRPGNAVQVDSGLSPLTVGGTFSEHCLALHGLTACPATSPAYSILVLKVTVLGRSKPVYVSIGLAGNGRVARTILYSLRAGTSVAEKFQKLERAATSAMSLPSTIPAGGVALMGSELVDGTHPTLLYLDPATAVAGMMSEAHAEQDALKYDNAQG